MSEETSWHTNEPYEPPASVSRSSFDVVLWRKPLAAAICYEGYSPSNHVMEPDVFDLFDVQAHPGNEPGTGTRIVRATLVEARRRGYLIGRSYLLNARMVTILSKMQAEEEIDGIRFFSASTRSTEELMKSDDFLDVAQATDYLNQPFEPDVGMRALDSVFQIVPYL